LILLLIFLLGGGGWGGLGFRHKLCRSNSFPGKSILPTQGPQKNPQKQSKVKFFMYTVQNNNMNYLLKILSAPVLAKEAYFTSLPT
jgi:hypothetical protein